MPPRPYKRRKKLVKPRLQLKLTLIFLGLGAMVIGIGNWYTHAKHLQTKADAGAFAGGGAWAVLARVLFEEAPRVVRRP